jgi:hypothetical protein
LLPSSALYARNCLPPMQGPDDLRLPFVELLSTDLAKSKTRIPRQTANALSK